MKKSKSTGIIKRILLLLAFLSGLLGLFWNDIPQETGSYILMVLGIVIFLSVFLWDREQRQELSDFAGDICETVDALMGNRQPENFHPYEDSTISKVQGKLLQYYDKMQEGQRQSTEDKQIIQELVSDISHQVKTPIANIQMFISILQQHRLSREKQEEFLTTMAVQVNKLDFLMQSLIKMSRLETGTFLLHMEEAPLYGTIAQAVSGIFTKAEQKDIEIEVDCDSQVTVKHDPKWTAEALGNILDNAVKYTEGGGKICVNVRPWQFYTRIDITDSGIGIPEKHYNDIFKRFYRAQEVAGKEGVGLGLYLARGIIARQKGYISVKSEPEKGTIFSVYLLS